LDTLHWSRILKELADQGVEKVVFSGGEPTLRLDLQSLCEKCKIFGMRFGFITNGFALSERLVENIVAMQPFGLGVSLDGGPRAHGEIRGEQSWWRAVESLRMINKLGSNSCAITTISKVNIHDLDFLAKLLLELDVHFWQIQLAMPMGRMLSHTDQLISKKQFDWLFKKIVSLRKTYGTKLSIESADCFGLAKMGQIRSIDWQGCTAGLSSLGIDSRGNVLPCLSLQGVEPAGNLLEQSLVEIWNNSSAFDFNRHFNIKNSARNCRSCDKVGVCRGGCASLSRAYTGKYHHTPFCHEKGRSLAE